MLLDPIQDIDSIFLSVVDDRQKIKFSRVANTSDSTNDMSLAQPVYMLYARGPYYMTSSQPVFSYHSVRQISNEKISFTSCTGNLNDLKTIE